MTARSTEDRVDQDFPEFIVPLNVQRRVCTFLLAASFNSMSKSEVTIREAGPGDLETILHHRRSMFRDMGEGSAEELDRMVDVARPWLERASADGSYHHWLAINRSGQVAGGGGVLLSPWPANPKDACTERAVILNVYTESEFRRRGVARLIMQVILEWVRAYGLRAVNLHASNEGRALYEKLGFVQTNEMRLRYGDSK
jgi:GNAT superfamily N-acetyltransferase